MLVETNRKIQRIGKEGAYFMSIDKNWVKANEIKKGDKLKLLLYGSIIIVISPNSKLLNPEIFKNFKAMVLNW